MAAKKMMLQPKIPAQGLVGFLIWARRDNRALYDRLMREFPEVAAFEERMQLDTDAGMAGLMDVLSSFGSGVANVAKSVGSGIVSGASQVFGGLKSSAGNIFNFVKNNALPIAATAAPVIIAKRQADVTNRQLELAAINQYPQQTAVTYDSAGNRIVVPVGPAMGNVSGRAPSWLLPAALVGGGVILLTLFVGRKR
jgi:hypothetical protein